MSQPFPFFRQVIAHVGFGFQPARTDLTSSVFLRCISPRFLTRIVHNHVHDVRVSPSRLVLTGLHHGRVVLRAIECSGMGVTIELQNLGDAQLCRDVTAHLEHTFSGRQGDWRVSIAGSRASENWDLRVGGPNGFERSYTLSAAAGEHEPAVIRALVLRLLPSAKT